MKTIKLMAILLFSIILYSCANDSENDLIEIEQDIDDDVEATEITYDNTIMAIMDTSCVECHSDPPRNGAPFPLVNFEQVSGRANAIFNAMSRQSGAPGAMPPSGRLPQNTIDEIQEWITNGLPEN